MYVHCVYVALSPPPSDASCSIVCLLSGVLGATSSILKEKRMHAQVWFCDAWLCVRLVCPVCVCVLSVCVSARVCVGVCVLVRVCVVVSVGVNMCV